MHILAVLPHVVSRSRIQTALSGWLGHIHGRAYICNSWSEALLCVPDKRLDILIFDPFERGAFDLSQCKRVHNIDRSIVLIPYGRFDSAHVHPQEILALAELGVQTIVVEDRDDSPYMLTQVLDTATTQTVSRQVVENLRPLIPPDLQPCIDYLIYHSWRQVTPAELAKTIHCHPRTLRRRLSTEGLPSTQKLTIWIRMLLAARLLSLSRRTTEQVAVATGFASGPAMRNHFQRHGRISLTEARHRSGYTILLDRFRQQCQSRCVHV